MVLPNPLSLPQPTRRRCLHLQNHPYRQRMSRGCLTKELAPGMGTAMELAARTLVPDVLLTIMLLPPPLVWKPRLKRPLKSTLPLLQHTLGRPLPPKHRKVKNLSLLRLQRQRPKPKLPLVHLIASTAGQAPHRFGGETISGIIYVTLVVSFYFISLSRLRARRLHAIRWQPMRCVASCEDQRS